MKILIVEDEEDLVHGIATSLSKEGYLCDIAHDFEQAIQKIDSFRYACIVLDLNLPGGDGLKILAHLREISQRDGVIIVSARNAVDDKIQGLKIGADDYLTKPFHISELSARIYAIIRRKNYENSNIVAHHEIQIDLISKRITVFEKEVNLTKREFDLLVYFVGNTNRVIPKSAIAEYLSGDLADKLESYDFIYSHIKNMKKKLMDHGAKNYLKTIYGSGYKWQW